MRYAVKLDDSATNPVVIKARLCRCRGSLMEAPRSGELVKLRDVRRLIQNEIRSLDTLAEAYSDAKTPWEEAKKSAFEICSRRMTYLLEDLGGQIL